MTAYVAGFLFDESSERVVLVRKGKPEWQRGRLNGVGGKIEPGETEAQAMRREFAEEAGVTVEGWEPFAIVWGSWGWVQFFRANGDVNSVYTAEAEGEQIEVHDVSAVPWDQCLPNLSWLIPLALYRHDAYVPVIARERAP